MTQDQKIISEEIGIRRIYIKDLSFESPAAPAIFQEEWKPEVNLELNTTGKKLGDNFYEVVLVIRVTVKKAESTAFLIELQQAGVFEVRSTVDEDIKRLLGSDCPTILFPYAREVISDIVSRGTFPQLLLAPVNFDALFQEAESRRTPDPAQVTH
ncbi:MAG: protein-export chaperone SecB [Pseudomonadota bacterium]